jgi:hypothetical protein
MSRRVRSALFAVSVVGVGGGFLVIFNEFLQENMAARYGR